MPLALVEIAIDWQASSVRVRASTVPSSGLQAPARTARPIPDRASARVCPGRIRPAFSNPTRLALDPITTSTGSPRSMRAGIEVGVPATELPHWIATFRPVAVSKAGANASRAALKPPEQKALIAAIAGLIPPPAARLVADNSHP